MSDDERSACHQEELDIIEERVLAEILKLEDFYVGFEANISEYHVLKDLAETTQCSVDFTRAREFKLKRQIHLSIMQSSLDELLMLYSEGRLGRLRTRLQERNGVISLQFVESEPEKVLIRLNLNEDRYEYSNQVSWRESPPYYYNEEQDSIVFVQMLPEIPDPQETTFDIATKQYNRVDWTVEATSLAGPRTKAFSDRFAPPEGYKYCTHTFQVISAIRVCSNYLGTGPDGVRVSAQVRSKPGTKARGWYDFQVSVTGISTSATSCQKVEAGCMEYQTIQPISPDASQSSCDRIEQAEASGAMLCEKTCFQGIHWCQYGENVSGRCRPVGLPEACGYCPNTKF